MFHRTGFLGTALFVVLWFGLAVLVFTSGCCGSFIDGGQYATKSGHKLRWAMKSLPITMWYHPKLPESYRKAYEQVSKDINKVVGHRVLGWGLEASGDFNYDRLPQGHMSMAPDGVGGKHMVGKSFAVAEMKWGDEGRLISVATYYKIEAIPESVIYNVVLHEVGGHGLGLCHDLYMGSIMHPKMSLIAPQLQKLTKCDRELLRKLYGNR